MVKLTFPKTYRIMNSRDTVTDLFFERLPSLSGESEEIVVSSLEFLRTIYPMITGSVYVIDLYKRCFRFVSPDHLFLCSHSPKEVMMLGYRFYPQIVHLEDMKLLINIHHLVFDYFHDPDVCLRDLVYVAFNFRIRQNQEELMVCHKVKPFMVNSRPQLAICVITESIRKTPGNLTAYYKGSSFCMQYSFGKRKWEQQPVIELTPQERRVLKLAKQGKSTKETARILNMNEQSARNLNCQIYRKLDVNSMLQAVIFLANHCLDLS